MSGVDRIFTSPSSATATPECAGHVLISGSYGGEYNAYHAGKWGLRGVVLNDAGGGKNAAGIRGLAYLDKIGLAAATADANTCHIGDGDHMLQFGQISHVNHYAERQGCRVGESVAKCAERMCAAAPIVAPMPQTDGGQRRVLVEGPGRRVIALDAAPMLTQEDTNAIVVTGSHAALFRGRPDNVISIDVHAIFFSDAGIGLDEAGVARLPTLDERGIAAACASARSAEIGHALSIYEDGLISRCNQRAQALGAQRDMPVRVFIEQLRQQRSAS